MISGADLIGAVGVNGRAIVEVHVLRAQQKLRLFTRRCLWSERAVNLFIERRWDLGKLRHRSVNLVNTFLEHVADQQVDDRSEERRVGKECRSRWWPDH